MGKGLQWRIKALIVGTLPLPGCESERRFPSDGQLASLVTLKPIVQPGDVIMRRVTPVDLQCAVSRESQNADQFSWRAPGSSSFWTSKSIERSMRQNMTAQDTSLPPLLLQTLGIRTTAVRCE
jgi:hypothetical protein